MQLSLGPFIWNYLESTIFDFAAACALRDCIILHVQNEEVIILIKKKNI